MATETKPKKSGTKKLLFWLGITAGASDLAGIILFCRAVYFSAMNNASSPGLTWWFLLAALFIVGRLCSAALSALHEHIVWMQGVEKRLENRRLYPENSSAKFSP